VLAGWHYLPGDADDAAPLPCATFLDLDASLGMRSPERLCRVYFKGKPQPQEIAQKANTWHQQGCRVQLGNEPNLPMEQFDGTPADYARWFSEIAARVGSERLYWAGMSPGVPGWQAWYERAVIADGIAAHAYGTFDQMREVVEFLIPLGKPLWLAEVNFGAGQQVDRDAWARDHFAPFLQWCSTQRLVEAVCYFSHRWPTPDMHLPTPVDGAGTGIERVLREFTPAVIKPPPNGQEPSMPSSPHHGAKRAETLGVVVHSTRSGRNWTHAEEARATVNWFATPQSKVSAHVVISPDEVIPCVDVDLEAWHARDLNRTHIGVELTQPLPVTPYQEGHYTALAGLLKAWSRRYGFPLVRVKDQTKPGLIGHEDAAVGKADAVPDTANQLRDRVYALAEQLQATGNGWQTAGHPQMAEYVRTAGEAIKKTVVISKGER
jgi:hypothetical protein